MGCWQCGALAALILGIGVGLLLSPLFSSCFWAGFLGVALILLGILLSRRK